MKTGVIYYEADKVPIPQLKALGPFGDHLLKQD